MSKYVDENYSSGYVEGDSVSSSEYVSCDLSNIYSELSILKSQNEALNDKLENILNVINTNKILSLSINDKVVALNNDVSNISTSSDIDLSSLVTKDYIDSKIPFVDDKSILIYPKGSEVLTAISGGIFIVESSCLLPINEYDFTVVYTLSKEIDGVKQYSNFNSKYVVLYSEENYMRVSDCASVNGG